MEEDGPSKKDIIDKILRKADEELEALSKPQKPPKNRTGNLRLVEKPEPPPEEIDLPQKVIPIESHLRPRAGKGRRTQGEESKIISFQRSPKGIPEVPEGQRQAPQQEIIETTLELDEGQTASLGESQEPQETNDEMFERIDNKAVREDLEGYEYRLGTLSGRFLSSRIGKLETVRQNAQDFLAHISESVIKIPGERLERLKDIAGPEYPKNNVVELRVSFKTDEGFVLNGVNGTSLIEEIESINGIPLGEVKGRLITHNEDVEELRKKYDESLTHQKLADFLRNPSKYNKQFELVRRAWNGAGAYVMSVFEGKIAQRIDYSIIGNGKAILDYSGFNPDEIEKYGFYWGYNYDPKSLEEDFDDFGAKIQVTPLGIAIFAGFVPPDAADI